MAMQEARSSVERVDDPGWSLGRWAVRIPFVGFFRYDRVIWMALSDDGNAGVLGGEIRCRHIIGSAHPRRLNVGGNIHIVLGGT